MWKAAAVGVMTCFWAAGTAAQQVPFDAQWTEQRFSLFSKNSYDLKSSHVDVESRGSVSLIWTPLPQAMWSGRAASWRWEVSQSVPATDLARRGGDDRNLAIYFVFLPEQAAIEARGAGIRSLLDNQNARVLMYVFGGAHARGDILASPYLGSRGKTVILRPAGTGAAAERVDLDADHRRAFGGPPEQLVGLAVSADSDDTRSAISARIDAITIE